MLGATPTDVLVDVLVGLDSLVAFLLGAVLMLLFLVWREVFGAHPVTRWRARAEAEADRDAAGRSVGGRRNGDSRPDQG